jgi:hypothetical protein
MHARFALIAAGSLLVSGLGPVAALAPPKTAAPSMVVYKSPT